MDDPRQQTTRTLTPYRAVPRGIEKGAMANGPLGVSTRRNACTKPDIPRERRAERKRGKVRAA